MATTRYEPSDLSRLSERDRAVGTINDRRQNKQRAVLGAAELESERQKLLAAGVMKSALPVISARMSPADRAQAAARMNQLGGASLNASRDPRLIGARLPTPVGAPESGLPAPRIAVTHPAQAITGTPAARAAVDDAISSGRFTGADIQTPRGVVSSRLLPKGAVEQPAVVTDTGVSRAPAAAPDAWDVALVKRYPQLKVEGSPENKAFVEKYNAMAAWAAQDPKNRKFDPSKEGGNIATALFAPKEDKKAVAAIQKETDSRASFLDRRTAPQKAIAKTAADAPAPTPGVPPWATTANKFLSGGMNPEYQPTTVGEMRDAEAKNAQLRAYTEKRLKENPNYNPWDDDPAPAAPMAPPSQYANPATPATSPVASVPGMPGYNGPVTNPLPLPDDNVPGMPNYTGAPVNPKPLSYNAPDADTQAFAQNPAEDEFRKKLREPTQYSGYA